MSAWEKDMKEKTDKLQEQIETIVSNSLRQHNKILKLEEEIKNFKEYEEIVQDITMEHVIRQDGKRIIESLKKE